MKFNDVPWGDQVYSHRDEEGVWRHFHASGLARFAVHGTPKPEIVTLPLDQTIVSYIESNAGIEEKHVERVRATFDVPIVLVEFEDGTSLVVDGNHRIVHRWRHGHKDVKAFLFKPGTWEQYLVEDFPIRMQTQELITSQPGGVVYG